MNHTARRTDSRLGRREQRQTARDARRERLLVLLARADRGALTPEDSAALRTAVEAEIAENETHRRSAGGHQAASMRLHKTLAAADECLVETEADRDACAVRLTRVEQLAARPDAEPQQAVEEIRRVLADAHKAARDTVEEGRR